MVWVNAVGDRMPMWCPPTPPAGDGDVYCDSWARALYRRGAAAEALLPAVHRREPRAARDARRARPAARAPPAPPSLFERGGPRPRPRPRPAHPPAAAHAPQPEWSPAEDAALRRALRLQRLPPEPPPAVAPNWEWVAELVGEAARAYRSARACRDRHEALADPERARRRHRRPPAARRRLDDERPRPPLHRLDAVRDAAERRRAAPKRRLEDPPHRNPKHAQLLADHGIDYDVPPTPVEVAARRADRIAREKLKAAAPQAPAPSSASSATAPPSAPVAAPQRVLVAAHGAAVGVAGAGAGGAGGKPDVRRARPAAAEAPRPTLAGTATSSAPTAQLLYRQQAFTARHLKILHQTVAPSAQAGGSGASADGGAALRKLQLQQLALRRATPGGGGAAGGAGQAAGAAPGARTPHPSHVVVTHIAAPPAHPAHPPSPAPRPPDSRQ